MIVVQVTYTVNEAYVDTNKALIHTFLADFEKLDDTQFLYSILQTEDGQTFIHTSHYKHKEIQETLLNTASFLRFQEQRDKNLIAAPKIEVLQYMGASRPVL